MDAPVEDQVSAQGEEKVEDVDESLESESFSSFSPEHRDFLSRLPYRVGLWISLSDLSGGEHSESAERHALDSIITAYTQDACKSEFVQRVMEETLARKAEWASWGAEIENVPRECEKAFEILSGHLIEKDLGGFQENLLEIAYAIARAYREEVHPVSFVADIHDFVRIAIAQITAVLARKPVPSFEELINISPAEMRAIKTLDRAIRAFESGIQPVKPEKEPQGQEQERQQEQQQEQGGGA